jgi:uncharacterized membrane protein YeaQ/YmgE (transglycosylase-associated protein family)
MSTEELCLLLLVGGLAGWLAGLILHRRGFGLAGNLIVGVIGSLLGRFALGLLGFSARTTLATLITAVLGALLLLWLLSFVPRGKKK